MFNREEILHQAVDGTQVTPEWAALQTVKFYRGFILEGKSETDALHMAKQEMISIQDEALRIRKIKRRELWLDRIAPWFVVVLGALACIGWWYLWA